MRRTSTADPAGRAHLLGRWAGTLDHHTAALAVWLAARRRCWWRPLLTATGDEADRWLDLAQAYRGSPGPGRQPGQFAGRDTVPPER